MIRDLDFQNCYMRKTDYFIKNDRKEGISNGIDKSK